MAVTFPGWYVGGFPDRELVVMDLLQPFLDLLTPQGFACSWLPPDYPSLLPIVRVYRGGGAVDYEGHCDPAAVQIGVIAETREDSVAVAEYCRQILLSYERGGTVVREDNSKTVVKSISEMVGPQLIPELNPDRRLVTYTYRVECPSDAAGTDYALIRKAL